MIEYCEKISEVKEKARERYMKLFKYFNERYPDDMRKFTVDKKEMRFEEHSVYIVREIEEERLKHKKVFNYFADTFPLLMENCVKDYKKEKEERRIKDENTN